MIFREASGRHENAAAGVLFLHIKTDGKAAVFWFSLTKTEVIAILDL